MASSRLGSVLVCTSPSFPRKRESRLFKALASVIVECVRGLRVNTNMPA